VTNRCDVKQQPWGQVSDKTPAVHRPEAISKVVVSRASAGQVFQPHGFQGRKWLIEKAKMALSTESAGLYYYDQVKRFK
jgi:hypothetical protein